MVLPSFHVHVSVFAVIGGLVLAYLGAARRHELATGERLEAGRRNRFLGGVAALFLGASWPIHDLAESYLKSGKKADAKKQTLAALEIAPSYERAQTLLLQLVN